MPFREPRRLPKRFPLSRFKNVLETDDFRLQKRRQRTFGTHKYRIILVVPRAGVVTRLTGRRLPVYELAHSDDLKELRSREWKFLLESIHREMPETLLPGTRERFHWILAYFTQLLLELDHANASNPATRPSFSLQQVDDNGEAGDNFSSEEEEGANSMYDNSGLGRGAATSTFRLYDSEEDEEDEEEEGYDANSSLDWSQTKSVQARRLAGAAGAPSASSSTSPSSSVFGGGGRSGRHRSRHRRPLRRHISERTYTEQRRAPPAATSGVLRARSTKSSRRASSDSRPRTRRSGGNSNSRSSGRGSPARRRGTSALSLRSPKNRHHHQENVSHTPRRNHGAVMSRYAMRIAIQRRDNILIIICMNAFVWFLRSNITLENVTTSQFYIALGAANLVLLCMYVARYCRLSAAFAALPSKLAEAPYFAFPRAPAATAADSGGSDEGERDYIDEESRGEDEENYREEDDEEDSVGEDSGIEPLESLGSVAASGGSGARRIVARDSDGNVVLGDTIKKLEDKDYSAFKLRYGKDPVNCWVPVDGSQFNLRVGPNYARNKRKEPSLQALYEVDTYDVFRSGEKHRHVYSRCTQPSGISQPGVLGIPRRFVVTVMLPDCAAANPLWGHYTGDGATIMFVISGSLRPEYLAALETLEALEVESQRDDLTADEADKIVAARTAARAKLPPSIDLLRRFVDESRTDKIIGNRFKLMANVLNLSESGLDSWSQSVLRRYNAKPCLTRPQHEFFVGPRLTYFEAWVDVHQFAYFARRVFDGIRHLLDGVNLNVGFCIEAQPDEEQPEQILMCFGARKIARDCEDMLDWPFGKKHPDHVPPPKSENSLPRSLPFSDAEEKTIF